MSPSLEVIRQKMDLGLNGLEIQTGDKEAYFKPSVPLISNLTSHEQLLNSLCKKAGLAAESWRTAPILVGITRWVHIIEQKGQTAPAVICKRLRTARTLSRKTLEEAWKASASRLLQCQRADGAYAYKYRPFQDQVDNAGFNMVRMAGCAYSMSAAAAALPDDALLKASASRAIEFLLRHARSAPNGGIYISEFGSKEGKLGTMALLARALQLGAFAAERENDRKQLLLGIMGMQNELGVFGGFPHDPQDCSSGQDYFPGEALSALAIEKNLMSCECRESVRRAYAPYLRYFRNRPAPAFVLWQVEAWAASWEWAVKEDVGGAGGLVEGRKAASLYAEFVFELADWVAQFQYQPEDAPEGRPCAANARHGERGTCQGRAGKGRQHGLTARSACLPACEAGSGAQLCP